MPCVEALWPDGLAYTRLTTDEEENDADGCIEYQFVNRQTECQYVTDDLRAPSKHDTTDDRSTHRRNAGRRLCDFLLTNLFVSSVVIIAVVASFSCYGWFVVRSSMTLDLSVKAFAIPSHKTSLRHDAFKQAMRDSSHLRLGRRRRDIGRIARVTQSVRKWKVQLVYLAVDDSLNKGYYDDDLNIFTPDRLRDIHSIERSIISHTNYTQFCHISYSRSSRGDCSALNSLLTYFYPSVSLDGHLVYDGRGDRLADVNASLLLAMSRSTFFWYVDGRMNGSNRRSRLLRSEIPFAGPLPGYKSTRDRVEEQQLKYEAFVKSYIPLLSKLSTSKVRVLYGNNEVFEEEMRRTFWTGLNLAFISGAAVCSLVFVFTSFSIWLTVFGLLSILLSFPLALFFYKIVFGVMRLGILNGVAIFVVIGIGIDDVFVFINTFRQAPHMCDLAQRLRHTISTAGKATFFTSFTTMAAFAANMLSPIPAIYEFGLFMSLVVICCWAVVMLMLPPVINIWYQCFAKCEHVCCKASTSGLCTGPDITLPPDISGFLDCTIQPTNIGGKADICTNNSNILMESMDDHHGGWPVYLGFLSHLLQRDSEPFLVTDNTQVVESLWEGQEGCGLTTALQRYTYHYLARPLIRGRWLAIVFFIFLLGISIALMTQLRVSRQPPQLFKSNTNLQMLMDLTGNFTNSDITCDECSAFYKESPVKPELHRTQSFANTATTTTTTLRHSFAGTMTSPLQTTSTSNLTSSVLMTTQTTSVTSAAYTSSPISILAGRTTLSSELTSSAMNMTTMQVAFTSTDGNMKSKIFSTLTSPSAQKIPSSSSSIDVTAKESSNATTQSRAATTVTTPLPPVVMTSPTTQLDQSSEPVVPLTIMTTQLTTNLVPPSLKAKEMTTTSHDVTTRQLHETTISMLTSSRDYLKTTARDYVKTTATNYLKTTTTTTTPKNFVTMHGTIKNTAPGVSVGLTTKATTSLEPTVDLESIMKNYDPCANGKCTGAKQRPILDIGAAIYVVFGIKDIDASNTSDNRSQDDKGSVAYDKSFGEHFEWTRLDRAAVRDLCRVCKLIAANTQLVRRNGSQCITNAYLLHRLNEKECSDVPRNMYLNGRKLPNRASAAMARDPSRLLWIAFAFESTTFKGQSYFSAYKEYQKWEAFIEHIKKDILPKDSPLQGMYQTSDFWTNVVMEVTATSSAIYGLVFSMVICTAAVAVFTTNVILLLIVITVILSVLCLVVAMFYLIGWQMGAIEAVCLSILVGSSVDYCVHLVEGYMLVGRNPPLHLTQSPAQLRQWRTLAALSHISVSICSSALTTVIAAAPLTFAVIRPFSKFGQIVAINTAVSIVYTMVVATALLATFAPARFQRTTRSVVIAMICVIVVVGVATACLFTAAKFGAVIPMPNGKNLGAS